MPMPLSGIDPLNRVSGGRESPVQECHSPRDTGAVSSALSSLISVTQRVFNSLQGRFHGLSCIPQSDVLLLYVDRQMLLVRVLLASAITPVGGVNGALELSQTNRGRSNSSISSNSKSGSSSSSSKGSLSYPSAKLLKDLLVLIDANISEAESNPISSSSPSAPPSPCPSPSPSSVSMAHQLQCMVDTLHCSIPRQLLLLCRRLTSTDFVSTFNTQVPTYCTSNQPNLTIFTIFTSFPYITSLMRNRFDNFFHKNILLQLFFAV